jgi:hypothetical protein
VPFKLPAFPSCLLGSATLCAKHHSYLGCRQDSLVYGVRDSSEQKMDRQRQRQSEGPGLWWVSVGLAPTTSHLTCSYLMFSVQTDDKAWGSADRYK